MVFSLSAFSFAPVFLDMRCISAGGGGVFVSPTPINYLHVKYINPLLMPTSELLRGGVGNRMHNLVLMSGSTFRFHALAGTLKVMVY